MSYSTYLLDIHHQSGLTLHLGVPVIPVIMLKFKVIQYLEKRVKFPLNDAQHITCVLVVFAVSATNSRTITSVLIRHSTLRLSYRFENVSQILRSLEENQGAPL